MWESQARAPRAGSCADALSKTLNKGKTQIQHTQYQESCLAGGERVSSQDADACQSSRTIRHSPALTMNTA